MIEDLPETDLPVRRWLVENGRNVVWLADKCGIPASAMYKISAGTRKPNEAIAKTIFEITEIDLLGNLTSNKPHPETPKKPGKSPTSKQIYQVVELLMANLTDADDHGYVHYKNGWSDQKVYDAVFDADNSRYGVNYISKVRTTEFGRLKTVPFLQKGVTRMSSTLMRMFDRQNDRIEALELALASLLDSRSKADPSPAPAPKPDPDPEPVQSAFGLPLPINGRAKPLSVDDILGEKP